MISDNKKYNILLLGSGAREHAIAFAIKNSNLLENLYVTPGNAGISKIADCMQMNLTDFAEIRNFCHTHKIDLIISGPEQPLADGIYDYMSAHDIKIVGPSKAGAQLESSKYFTKKICQQYNIPTARYEFFDNELDAKKYLKNCKLPVVIKQDSLAGGKGVMVVQDDLEEASKFIEKIFAQNHKIIIEEYLEGEELSFFALIDDDTILEFGVAKDFKSVGEGNTGPNTGGMGSYSTPDLITPEMRNEVMENIIKPTIYGLKQLNYKFSGILYAGLMLTQEGIKLLEFNIRLGDPETQSLLMRLDSDFLEIMLAIANNKLNACKIKFNNKSAICIVMASKGYPEKYLTGSVIKNLDKVEQNTNIQIFHGATTQQKDNIISSGGRVLSIIAIDDSLSNARVKAYDAIKSIDWNDGFYRKDI